ncbi:MAG: DEAD/DEAH box helicase family protein [Nanoarchaeota archaeon]
MIIELKGYQEDAVSELRDTVNRLLDFSENKVCVFKAPTGSGKTIMMAEALKRLVTDRIDNKRLSFIWISVRQLHTQSKEKLDRFFEDSRIIKCSDFEDLEDKRIGENEVLFFNWESINKKENLYVRDNEQDNNLSTVIANTKEDGQEIILVIDESHHTAKSEKSKEIVAEIAPKVAIEVTATPPKLEGHMVEVDFAKVIEEGMIKKEVSINPEIDKEKIKKSADELVLECALKKREEILKAYAKEGVKINPLVLIQLPDKKTGVIDRKDDIEQILRDKFKITEENGKLARWLSEDKTPNLANIEKNESDVEVLIFKHAISLGWDCPRAQILVLFREWQSLVFSIQTVGRIMRMPELKHYENDKLNRGYVYTNLSNIEIAEDIAKDYLTVYESKRNDVIYKNLQLNSIYLKRQREKTRLSGEFSKILVEEGKKQNFGRKISRDRGKLIASIMVDGKIVKLDEAQIVKSDKEGIKVNLTPKELQYRFDLLLRELCTPFAPADSSGVMRTALYKLFEKVVDVEDWDDVQKLVLSEANRQILFDLVNKAKEEYTEKIIKNLAEQREEVPVIWEVPEMIEHNSRYVKMPYKKSIMVPVYAKEGSKPEKEFIELLEKAGNKVIWWFKNGESEIKWFAVKYSDENGIERAFYVDFIVYMKDGSVGLFDTKSGRTAEDAKPKAEALAHYIERENKKGKKLWGGIAVSKDGSWRYNDSKKYEFNEANLGKDWKFLEF